MEKEAVIRNYGVSTETYFMIDAHRIPRKGLNTVYLDYERRGRYGHHMHNYELEFCYEDGSHFPVKLLLAEEIDFAQLIHSYDDNVKIYTHRKMREKSPLLCPFQRFRVEEPFVKKETLEELSTLCDGNSFWRLDVKSRDKWDGNKEVELTLYGMGVTWLLWLVWLCMSGYLFFYISIRSMVLGLLVLLGSGLFYYLFFVRSARKITEKAKDILAFIPIYANWNNSV